MGKTQQETRFFRRAKRAVQREQRGQRRVQPRVVEGDGRDGLQELHWQGTCSGEY